MRGIFVIILVIIITSCNSTKKLSTPVEETIEIKSSIEGAWLLETINQMGFDEPSEGNKMLQLQIYLDKKQLAGNDGCNQIKGSLKIVDEKNIIFGKLGGTKIMCPNMEVTDLFNRTLPLVKTYKIEKLKLYFFDTNGNEVLQFKRIRTTNNK